MLNLAYHYGILYQEQHGDMLFFFREELADKRTARLFWRPALCEFFKRSMQTEPMPIPPNLSHAFRSAFTMSCSPFFELCKRLDRCQALQGSAAKRICKGKDRG